MLYELSYALAVSPVSVAGVSCRPDEGPQTIWCDPGGLNRRRDDATETAGRAVYSKRGRKPEATMTFPVRCKIRTGMILAAVLGPSAALATDIIGIMPSALDQPRINAIIRYPDGNGGVTDPLQTDDFGGKTFNIQAFYDTGASGVLISNQTAEFLGLPGDNGIRRQM